jgi:hypothetical protein
MSKTSKAKPSSATRYDPLDRNSVESWARKHQVDFPTAEKVLWLTRVLRAVTASDLGQNFALMGGSAIVFLYRDMYRFSTDLDFDFVGNRNLGRKGMREVETRKEKDRATLEDISRRLGLKFKRRPKPQDRFVQYEMIFPSVYTRTGSIELDISYRYGHSVLGTVLRSWPIADTSLPAFSVNTFKEEELYASKAIAIFDVEERLDFPNKIGLFSKRKIRHLFDIYLVACEVADKKGKLNMGLLRDLFLLFGMTRIRNFEYYRGNAIGSYKDADIKAELLSVVPRDFPIPTADEMKWTVRKFLDQHFFKYTEREYRFMEDFRSGHFRPEDLFGAGDMASRLRDTQYYREILGTVKPLHKRGGSRVKRASGKALP